MNGFEIESSKLVTLSTKSEDFVLVLRSVHTFRDDKLFRLFFGLVNRSVSCVKSLNVNCRDSVIGGECQVSECTANHSPVEGTETGKATFRCVGPITYQSFSSPM